MLAASSSKPTASESQSTVNPASALAAALDVGLRVRAAAEREQLHQLPAEVLVGVVGLRAGAVEEDQHRRVSRTTACINSLKLPSACRRNRLCWLAIMSALAFSADDVR